MTIPTTNARHGRLLITGANGYIGRRLVATARSRGHATVVTLRDARRSSLPAGVELREFDLEQEGPVDPVVRGVDAVIHLAAILGQDSRPGTANEDLNVSGTRRLLEAARRRGVRRFVFLSSQSAAPDSPTSYGRSKWRIEQLLSGSGECAVRTGLVSGGPPRGLFGLLYRLARRFPVLPVLRPSAPVYPVHVDDLCLGLLSIVEDEREPPRLARIAAAESMRFGDYVRMLARSRLGRRVRLVPIPLGLVLGLCRLTAAIPWLPTVPRERVLGLASLPPMAAGSLPAPAAGPAPRDVARVLGLEGRGRKLLAEGRTLMRYAVGRRAPLGAARRYVRAVLDGGDGEPLALAGWVRVWPRLLRFTEPLRPRENDLLRARLSLATRIVEMTTQAAPKFHVYRESPRLVAWLELAWLVAVEALLLPSRWLAGRGRRR